MTPQQEAAFERKAEKMLRGHRQAPDGRDYRAFVERFRLDVNNPEFDARYDATFKGCPGSADWLDDMYCPKCDKRKEWCECRK
jgi:hypothetical protein